MFLLKKKTEMVTPEEALRGRPDAIPTAQTHFVNGHPLKPPFPEGLEQAMFAMGCFWGAERVFWQLPGAWVTAVGYSGGFTPNPFYEEVCTGRTGHAEAVLVVFDPAQVTYERLLKAFWENHDPTQGMRQGNDIGTQYRSGAYAFGEGQLRVAESSRVVFQNRLRDSAYGHIATEIAQAGRFYYAEDYHQQYLAKNPHGYCGLGETGVSCPVGVVGAS